MLEHIWARIRNQQPNICQRHIKFALEIDQKLIFVSLFDLIWSEIKQLSAGYTIILWNAQNYHAPPPLPWLVKWGPLVFHLKPKREMQADIFIHLKNRFAHKNVPLPKS